MLLAILVSSAFALPPEPTLGPAFGKGCDLRDTHPEPRRYFLSVLHTIHDVVVNPEHPPLVSGPGIVDPTTPIGVTWVADQRSAELPTFVDGVRLLRSGFLY